MHGDDGGHGCERRIRLRNGSGRRVCRHGGVLRGSTVRSHRPPPSPAGELPGQLNDPVPLRPCLHRRIWRGRDLEAMLSIFGVRKDHMWQAAVFPLLLTSLLYAGSLVLKIFLLISRWYEVSSNCSFWNFVDCIHRLAYNVMAWRNYVVAPFTEELVFRACMIPLLLCGGYKTYNVIFFSPVFFSLAHLNHFLELYYQQNYSFSKAFLLIGVQLGYTVIFGCYASFLFIRTGNLISPIVAHILCNIMGLPVFSSSRTKGVATIVFAAGLFCFFWLLFPASSPDLYNDKVDGCLCWHGYCNWS